VARQGGALHQGHTARGEGRTSARLSWPMVGDDDARVSGRGVVSGRSGASERGLSSGTGAVRIGGGDDRGREVKRRFGGKRLSVDLEGDGAYIVAPTFCHGSYSQP
jgi:hypothetical protein